MSMTWTQRKEFIPKICPYRRSVGINLLQMRGTGGKSSGVWFLKTNYSLEKKTLELGLIHSTATQRLTVICLGSYPVFTSTGIKY